MARIAGVKSIHIAKIESYGENGKPTYGEIKELKQFISFSSTKNFSEMNWYSNDIVEETFKSVVDMELEIVLGKLDNETKGLIMGSEYNSKGVLVEKADDAQAEFAVIVVLSQMGSTNTPLELYSEPMINAFVSLSNLPKTISSSISTTLLKVSSTISFESFIFI